MTTPSIIRLSELLADPTLPSITGADMAPEVLNIWYDLVKSLPECEYLRDTRVAWHPKGGIALTAGDEDELWWGNLGEIVTPHPPLPTHLSMADYFQAITEIVPLLGADAVLSTETMCLPAPINLDEQKHFLWLNSPVALLCDNYQVYLEGLTKRRRRQAREDHRAWQAAGLHLEIVEGTWPASDWDWMVDQSRLRWGEDSFHNINMMAYGAAVALMMPAHHRLARVLRADGSLQALGSFIEREPNELLFQGYTPDHARPLSNVGSGLLTKMLRWMHEQPKGRWTALDPTCRTDLAERTIDVYKRHCINLDMHRPLLLAGNRFAAVTDFKAKPPYWFGDTGWRCEMSYVGDGV